MWSVAAPSLLASWLAAAGWCDALGASLEEPWPDDDAARVAAVERSLATLPTSAQPIAGQVRSLLGKDGAVDEARSALTALRRDGCTVLAAHDGSPGQETAALIASDPRFGGTRVGDDVIDRLLDRVGRWFTALFESEGMRRYAGAVRIVYLALLLAAVAAVAFWLVRARRRIGRAEAERAADARARVERRRIEAADALFREAEAKLDLDPHGAAAFTFCALAARVGELAPGTVTPARTGRELVAQLDDARARIVEPPFSLFDRVYFGRATTPDDARALLSAAKGADRALAGVDGGARP